MVESLVPVELKGIIIQGDVMRTTIEIMNRAEALFLLANRVVLEYQVNDKQKYSYDECEKTRVYFFDVSKRKNIELSSMEWSILEAPLGQLQNNGIIKYEYSEESVAILLWSVGIYNFPEFDGTFSVNDDEFAKILGQVYCTCDERESLNKGMILRPELELKRQVTMLWHWRAVESQWGLFRSWNRFNKAVKKESAHDILIKTFGGEFKTVIDSIPIAKTAPRDFLVGNKRYCELDKKTNAQMLLITKWRHHAMEWLCGEESWENISTDT